MRKAGLISPPSERRCLEGCGSGRATGCWTYQSASRCNPAAAHEAASLTAADRQTIDPGGEPRRPQDHHDELCDGRLGTPLSRVALPSEPGPLRDAADSAAAQAADRSKSSPTESGVGQPHVLGEAHILLNGLAEKDASADSEPVPGDAEATPPRLQAVAAPGPACSPLSGRSGAEGSTHI